MLHITSCRCFSHTTAYWPMWLFRLTTLLFSWNVREGEGFHMPIAQVSQQWNNRRQLWNNGMPIILTEDLISLALLAYFSALWVSSYDLDEGLTLAIITVLQLPPKESLSSRVSLLSLYGIWVFLLWNRKDDYISPKKQKRFDWWVYKRWTKNEQLRKSLT